MGCRFCATGTMGFKSNLSSGEIVEQLVHASRYSEIRNIVFMVIPVSLILSFPTEMKENQCHLKAMIMHTLIRIFYSPWYFHLIILILWINKCSKIHRLENISYFANMCHILMSPSDPDRCHNIEHYYPVFYIGYIRGIYLQIDCCWIACLLGLWILLVKWWYAFFCWWQWLSWLKQLFCFIFTYFGKMVICRLG